MAGKELGRLTAGREWVNGSAMDGRQRSSQGNRVHVRGAALWLKGEPMVSTYMTPREARTLAIELLSAAERIDKDTDG